ncbi:MAG: amino acid adenylation domain-containing protein, partial [Acidobacteriota bacterium]
GAPAGSVLLLVLHHIVTDFWSLAILLRDLAALLRQEASGSPAALPPLALCYKDFARWQEDWLASAAAEQQLNFWRDRLAAAPPSMQLPTDRRRPALLENRGATCLAQLGVELSTTLSDLARRRGVTVFVAALAAFQALLHRWSGQRAVALGTPMAGREVAGLADVMGYFTNPVVLCSDTSTDPTVDEWIESTQQSVLDALEHQLAPFPWLVDRLEPRREANRSPFFDILFVQEKGQRPEDQGLAASFVGRCGPSIDCGGMEAVCLPLAERDALFDLTLRMAEVDDVQMLAALYRSELYDETTIRRLLGHYLEVLRSFVAEPDPRLSQLRFLSPPERQQLLVEWGTATDVAAAENLGDVWARTVHRSPEAVAAVHGEQQLTYYDLDQRAGRLAEALCRVGAAPEHRIGLCVERGLDLLIGLLGIVRSGAAYVPLDPAHPSARLRRIAQTSDLAAVVVDSAGGQSLGRWAEMLPTLCLVGGAVAPSNESGARGTPRSPVRREQIAYCLYTSGSTGRPKGVEVSHGAATRLLRATTEIFDFAADDVWTLFHSYGFDFSVWEMWGAWASGGRLVVVPHGVSRAPASFRRLLAEQAVTVLNQTPSAFSQLSAEEIEERARDTTNLALRWVIFGGEALETRHLAGWLTRYGDQKPRLVNMYGITETTVHVTARRVRCADRTGAGEGTIGRAISDLALRVFDPRSRPVAVGVAGELNVGGAGLAQGYQGDPVATAERFVPDPHPGLGRVGARLYRSGDRVRQRPDGSLDYLARVDDQIQLRGFRIEPAEIEAVLLDHPAVHQALVRLREQGGEQRLLAYVVLAAGGGQDPTALVPALRERLGRQLPDYMQPSAILCLDRWPLTAHGKLDHQALPLPSGRRPDLATAYTAPDSEAELLVASIWREVLALDRVGADDNFFEAGGHSLQLTRVHRRLISRGYDVSIVDLLRWPTIRSLARCLGRSAPSSVGAVRRQPARRPLRRQGAIRRRHRAARGAAGE